MPKQIKLKADAALVGLVLIISGSLVIPETFRVSLAWSLMVTAEATRPRHQRLEKSFVQDHVYITQDS